MASADRFLNNLDVAPDRSEAERVLLSLYKAVASQVETRPVYVYADLVAPITAIESPPNQLPVAGNMGINFNVQVKDDGILNNITTPNIMYEITLLDTQINRYAGLPINIGATQLPAQTQSLYIKIDNLSKEPYDFEVTPPSEKTNNNKLYIHQRNFPSTLNLKVGHVITRQNSADFGTFYDMNNQIFDTDAIDQPFALFYSQSVYNMKFRLSIRMIPLF